MFRKSKTTEKQNEEIVAIPVATAKQALQKFRIKFQECIIGESKNLDDIMFKKK